MEYMIQGETLTAIADAIRGKTGGTSPIDANQMAAEISNISAGGGLPAGISALASGTYTVASETTSDVKVEHDLGATPNFFVWVLDGTEVVEPVANLAVAGVIIGRISMRNTTTTTKYKYITYEAHYDSTASTSNSTGRNNAPFHRDSPSKTSVSET